MYIYLVYSASLVGGIPHFVYAYSTIDGASKHVIHLRKNYPDYIFYWKPLFVDTLPF